jgi:predicted Zn-dependent peptidase
VAGVTLDDARRVAARLLDPAKLLVVAVGQPVGLAASE